MRDQTKTEHYLTNDLGLAAALVSCGHILEELDRSDRKKVQFIFCQSKELNSDANDYWSDRLSVSGRAFFNNLKMLKNRIYSEWSNAE